MKNKILTVLLVGVLVFSTLGLALAEQVKCTRCNGTGEIFCPTCGGTGQVADAANTACPTCDGTGQIDPHLIMVSMNPHVENGQTIVDASYKNQESTEVKAKITASIQDHIDTSEEMTFPPGEEVPVQLTIDYVGTYSMLQLVQSVQMSVDPTTTVTCPDCGGTGISASAKCPDCNGDGIITCPDCKGSGYVEAGLFSGISGASGGISPTVIGGAGAGVAIAVVAVGSVVLLRKRGVSEKKLRRMPSGEFQQWVLKKLDGTPATSRDIAMGFDGFTRLHEPIAIKQSDSVGLAVIDSFAASLAKNRARGGTIVAFGFSDDAIRGKIRARTTYRLNIEMMTVQDIINRR